MKTRVLVHDRNGARFHEEPDLGTVVSETAKAIGANIDWIHNECCYLRDPETERRVATVRLEYIPDGD